MRPLEYKRQVLEFLSLIWPEDEPVAIGKIKVTINGIEYHFVFDPEELREQIAKNRVNCPVGFVFDSDELQRVQKNKSSVKTKSRNVKPKELFSSKDIKWLQGLKITVEDVEQTGSE